MFDSNALYTIHTVIDDIPCIIQVYKAEYQAPFAGSKEYGEYTEDDMGGWELEYDVYDRYGEVAWDILDNIEYWQIEDLIIDYIRGI